MRRIAQAASLLSLLTLGSFAHATNKAECAAASERGQKLRDDGKYIDARASFVTCASEACPAMIRQDCGEWLGQIDKTMPSIVVVTRDADGHDVDATVTLDATKLNLDGRPIVVDPGVRTMRATLPNGAVIDERVTVRAGEQNRQIVLQAPAAKKTEGVVAKVTDDKQPVPADSVASKSYVPTIVLGSIGVVSMASFAAFGLSGKGDLDNLRSTCAPYCAQADLDAAKLKLTIADISLAVGIVSLAAAVVFIFVPKPSKSTAALRWDPTPSGLRASF